MAGFLCAWVVTYVVVAAYCFHAYARGTAELDTLLFGMLSSALAVLSGGAAALAVAATPASARWALAAVAVGRVAAATFLLHFASAYTHAVWRRRSLFALYAALGGLLVLSVGGELGGGAQLRHHEVQLAFATASVWFRPPTPDAVALTVLLDGAVLGAAIILGGAVLAGRREALPAVLGTAGLVASVVYDGVWSLRGVVTPILLPLGYSAFAIGVVVAMLSSYAALRLQLERRARDLKHGSKELERSYKALKAAQAKLVHRQQLAAIGELSAVVAHEVRNPLAIITTAAATLRRDTTRPEERTVLLGILDEEVSRLNRLVGDLLVYARPVNIERQPVTLRDLAQRALTLADGRTHIATALVESEPVEPVPGDPNLLRQALDNLVANALQAMPDGGTLTVTLMRAELQGAEGVELAIEDTGEGMSTAVRSRAGDPFFTTRPSGTGLGLAIVARIMRAHGGRLRIESASGEGTTARLFLPTLARRVSGEQESGDPATMAPSMPAPPPLQIELRDVLTGRTGTR